MNLVMNFLLSSTRLGALPVRETKNMKTGAIMVRLEDEIRNLDLRIELADAREEQLAQAARKREAELDELFTETGNDPYLDRLSDLANRAIARHLELKWRREQLSRASGLVEEVADSITNARRQVRERRARA
jgi:hypothetical protein